MNKENRDGLANLIKVFIESTEKHNEILEKQMGTLTNQQKVLEENTINKECKSKIYEKINAVRDEVVILKKNVDQQEKNLKQLTNYILGDGVYSKGIISDLEEIKQAIGDFKNFVREQTTTKKNIISLYSFLSGFGGIVVYSIIQKFF